MIANGASDYLVAAKALRSNPLNAPHPYWFCVFQSIELSFKAYLRGKGFSKEDLKSAKLGHRLRALYELAKSHDLKDVVALTCDEEIIVCDAGEMYSKKVFQYTEAAWKSLPYAYQAYAVAEKLLTAIRPFAERQRTLHHEKPTAVQ